MESDKYITICESVGGVQQIATIDMTAGNTITRQKISAEAAIMNPNSKIIALKGITNLQSDWCMMRAYDYTSGYTFTAILYFKLNNNCNFSNSRSAATNLQFGSPQQA